MIADVVEELFGEGKDLLKFLVKLERQVKALGKTMFLSLSL